MQQCPRCIRPLEETSWMEVSLKGCPLCGGTWFPGGHLDLLAQNVPQTLADLEAQWSGSQPTPQITGGTLWCPECEAVELQPLCLFPEPEPQPVGCPQCQGVWLGEGMLIAFHRQLEAGWQVPAGGLGTLIQAKSPTAEEPEPASPVESEEPAPPTTSETSEMAPPEPPPEEPFPAAEPPASPETEMESKEPLPEEAVVGSEMASPEEPFPAAEAPPPPETAEEVQEQPPLEPTPPTEAPETAPPPPVEFEEAPVLPEPEAPTAPPPVEFEEAPAAAEPEAPSPEVEAPSPWVCVHCGAELPAEAKFCARCGKSVKEKGRGWRVPSWKEVSSAVCPRWKEALQPFRPGDSRKAWQGAALGAAAGIILGLLTLLIPGWIGKLVGLVVLFGGAAAAAAFILYPTAMARRSPQGTHSLLLAALTGFVLGFPLGLFFAPFMRPILRGALTGWLLVVVMEQGPSAYCSHLADLGRLAGNTIARFFPTRKPPEEAGPLS